MVEKIRVELPEANQQLKEKCYNIVRSIYGESIPEPISKRLEEELYAIERNGYATLYIIASDIVKVSRDRGYCVTERGPVGSSLVAYLCGMTDVNPLQAHYVCNDCHHFETPAKLWNELWNPAADLEKKDCPICGQIMYPEGTDILPEISMGEMLDKEPSIVLNFAPCIRTEVIKYIKERFKEDWVFRAGVTLDGAVTGVHPGGLYIVPSSVKLDEFTTLKECDDDSGMYVSEKDCHELDKVFKRYDILVRHELELLHDLEIAREMGFSSDNRVTEVFSNDYTYRDIVLYPCEPRLISATNPKSFSDFVRLLSFSLAVRTDDSMRNRLLEKEITLKEVICCRDDIMQYLINKGVDRQSSYRIMNNVLMGKRLTKDMKVFMQDIHIPEWFIMDCDQIRYLYPRSQMCAYMKVYWDIAMYLYYYPHIYKETFAHWIKEYGDEIGGTYDESVRGCLPSSKTSFHK